MLFKPAICRADDLFVVSNFALFHEFFRKQIILRAKYGEYGGWVVK